MPTPPPFPGDKELTNEVVPPPKRHAPYMERGSQQQWSILDCDVPFGKAVRWVLVVGAANAVPALIAAAIAGLGFLLAAILDRR